MEVINTQWLYKETADFIRETDKQIIVAVNKKIKRFWKNNGLEVGYSKVLRMGCEPDRLNISKQEEQ